jgi:hypothetical protein
VSIDMSRPFDYGKCTMDKTFIDTLRCLQLQAFDAGQPLISYLLAMAEMQAKEGVRNRNKPH